MDNDAYDDATLVKVSTKCPSFPDSLKYELVSSGSEQFLFSAVGRLFFFGNLSSPRVCGNRAFDSFVEGCASGAKGRCLLRVLLFHF